ncbi:EAL domain-containing protein [Pseudoalteromonas sp.]|uniref:EAL domain-containing protein n=1 Tax=Pseudoalteromonas sp. TaxID=53249 RepID=UPI00356631E6
MGTVQATIKKHPKKLLVVLLSGGVIFAIGCVILMYFAGQKLTEQTRSDSQYLLAQVDQAIEESTAILKRLNSMGFADCNDANLLAMRQQLFDAHFVIDIGFFKDNKLICTTGAGVLAKPIPDNQPDYFIDKDQHSQIGVRFEPELYLLLFTQRSLKVIIVRQASYNLILKSAVFGADSVVAANWQIFYQEPDALYHLAGQQGLYDATASNNLSHYETDTTCSSLYPSYCVAVELPWALFLSDNKELFIISFILICLVSVSSGLVIDDYITSRRSLISRVRRGLKKDRFYWVYQPIVNLKNSTVIGCEVLARFEDNYGTLTPDEFIPALRKTNLTWHFTQKMIAVVLKELATVEQLPSGFKVALNIFPYDVEQGNVSLLCKETALTQSKFKIFLEITEDEYLDSAVAHEHFKTLIAAGFNLSLDDFGTGYSNLKNLHHLSFQQLKIDRSFVQDIATEGLKASMIPNIMELVHKFGYTCVAEGIETLEQEVILKAAGVQYGQGWKYGRPMAIVEFNNFIGRSIL